MAICRTNAGPKPVQDINPLVDGTISKYSGDVSVIRQYAFYSCSQLTEAFAPCRTMGISAFCYCSQLETASFPALLYIPSYAFYGCQHLTNIIMPSVSSINSYAFTNASFYCDGTIVFGNISMIGSYAFSGCYFESGVMYETGSKAFSGYFASLQTLGSNAFWNAYGYFPFSIKIPANLTFINSSAFAAISTLQRVDFTDTTKSIYLCASAFNACTKLSYYGGWSQTSIFGSGCFSNCSFYATYITTSAGHNVAFFPYACYNAFKSVTAGFTFSVPKCYSIGSWAFYYFNNTNNAIVYMYFNTNSTNSAASLYIGSSAFRYAKTQAAMSFRNVSYIGSYAFANCSVKSYYFYGSSVPTLAGSNAFLTQGYTGWKIYVPSSLYTTWKAATYWSYWSNYIVSHTGA